MGVLQSTRQPSMRRKRQWCHILSGSRYLLCTSSGSDLPIWAVGQVVLRWRSACVDRGFNVMTGAARR